jgi:hypothetical protein
MTAVQMSARCQSVTITVEEAERRKSRTDRIEELFRSRPGAWINVPELADVGGFCAWRTRVADARQRIEQVGDGTIEWNRNIRASAYRWVPLTRDETPPARIASQPTLL